MAAQFDVGKAIIQASSILDGFKQRIGGYTGSGFEMLEQALKYPLTETLSYADFIKRYERQDVANRVVSSPVNQSWSTNPEVTESVTESTRFERQWVELAESLDLYTSFSKVDLLSRIGRYAVLILGVADGRDASMELGRGSELRYVNYLPQPNAKVVQWEDDISSPRFGAPSMYEIEILIGNEQVVKSNVHWSRVIHVAQSTVSDKYNGIPTLLPIYNRLIGLEMLASGSPEMYWRGARPGYVASSGGSVLATDAQIESFKEAISDLVNNLNRYVYAEDLDIKSLAPQVVSPKEHAELILKLISASTRIPLRILIGSERGELSSDQDERAWLSFIEARRVDVCNKLILEPFINRLIDYAMIYPPNKEYFIRWKSLMVLSDRDQAEIARIYADAMKKYDEAPGIRDIIPPNVFRKYIMRLDDEAITMADDSVDQYLREETIEEDRFEDGQRSY